jgi:hypothetical protein
MGNDPTIIRVTAELRAFWIHTPYVKERGIGALNQSRTGDSRSEGPMSLASRRPEPIETVSHENLKVKF